MSIRAGFFATVRKSLFGGKLTTGQVIGMETMLDYWELRFGSQHISRLAYAFATAYHETARTFGPIHEFGKGRGKPYAPYYGRGLVQLTWKVNYATMGSIFGVDMVKKPDLALELRYAVPILFIGMERGLFTGRDWFKDLHENPDYKNARRMINGTDRAALIAGYAKKFEEALR